MSVLERGVRRGGTVGIHPGLCQVDAAQAAGRHRRQGPGYQVVEPPDYKKLHLDQETVAISRSGVCGKHCDQKRNRAPGQEGGPRATPKRGRGSILGRVKSSGDTEAQAQAANVPLPLDWHYHELWHPTLDLLYLSRLMGMSWDKVPMP